MIKINRRLKKEFKSQEELESKIKADLKPDANGNVSVDQVRDFILTLVENDMLAQKVTKRDIEGFLSAFNYNTYGATNVDNLSKLIFLRDDQVGEKLAERKWANPPPVEVNKDIPVSSVTEQDMHNSKIRDLFGQMEDRVFQGKIKMYQVFRQFDVDGDGYVSHQDFDNYIKKLKVDASKQEVASMMKLLDKQNQGYLTFTDFSKVFNPHMSTQLVNVSVNDSYLPNMAPSEEIYKMRKDEAPQMQTKVDEIRNKFKPDPDQSKYFRFKILIIYFCRTSSIHQVQRQACICQYIRKLLAGEEWSRFHFRA